MTALAADKLRTVWGRPDPIKDSIGMKDNSKVYGGSLISITAAEQLARVAGDTASTFVIGVASKTVDNTGGADSALNCPFEWNQVEAMTIASGTLVIKLEACVADDNNLTDAATATNDISAGVVRGISGSTAYLQVAATSRHGLA